LVKIWFSLANLRQSQGQFTAAVDAYRQTLKLRPDSAPIYNNLGYTFYQQGKWDEAIACYKKALELKPEFTEADVNLGNALHIQGKLSPEQQAHYAQLNYKLGFARKDVGDFKAAETYWQTALKLNPNYDEVYIALGEIYQTQKKLQEAAAAFRQGLTLINPHYAKAVEAGEETKIPQPVPVTPPIPQREVIVGNYSFPAILTVADNTDKRPFWSVVIPVFNRTEYVLECLVSVLRQWPGEEEMEIIVVDNASTPPMYELVNAIAKGIVRYYRNPQNLGPLQNFNTGIALSRGQWIHLLNDDDYVLPGFYSQLQQSLEACPDSVGAAFTGYQNINEKGKVVFSQNIYGDYRGVAHQDWLWKIGVSNPLNMVAVVIRRETHERLGGYHPELKYTSDWELYKRIAAAYDWWYEPGILACYRQHSNNITSEHLLSGIQGKFIRQAIEFSESYLPTNLCSQITAKARNHDFDYCLAEVMIPLKAGNLVGVFCLLQETLKIDSSPQAIAKLFTWLTKDEAAPLRDEITTKLLAIPRENIPDSIPTQLKPLQTAIAP